jgi:hypothetical protein
MLDGQGYHGRGVDRVELGARKGPANAGGTLQFDGFESRRNTYIGY